MSNLLKEILERVEYERLIEEGKDHVEVLHYKFQHIPAEIIDDVIAIDPTKKKSYSQWLLSKWDDEKNTIINGLDSYKFYSWQNKKSYGDYGTNFDPQHTPQEVLNMYNLIFGQQESITRNFKDYVKRINEVMKYRYNDLID